MLTQNGIRKRQIDLGPWQPSEELARSWAQFLEATGRYDSVMVESNGPQNTDQDRGQEEPDEDMFLEMGQL